MKIGFSSNYALYVILSIFLDKIMETLYTVLSFPAALNIFQKIRYEEQRNTSDKTLISYLVKFHQSPPHL